MTVSFLSSAVHHAAPPPAREPVAPSSAAGLADEWRTLLLPPRLLAALPRLVRQPRGDGAAVVDVPGWKAPEASMAPLRGYLRALGHDARGWGLGTNTGDPERDAPVLAAQVERVADETGRPVALVGWSLGGVVAREAARQVPHAVRRVITYGTPVVGGPSYTLGASAYGPAECARIDALLRELDRTDPITVPITAIFTRRDRVVDWPACLDRTSADVEHVEVRSTHLGMGLDPAVWTVVAGRL
ncbi:MAG: alpha/beta fold hydrolase [Candidatus Nanopelagicales bacterium]